jgi:hypothetical protein
MPKWIFLNTLLHVQALVVTFKTTIFTSFNATSYENAEGNTNPNNFTEGAGFGSQYIWTNTLRYNQKFGKHDVSFVGEEANNYKQPRFAGWSFKL